MLVTCMALLMLVIYLFVVSETLPKSETYCIATDSREITETRIETPAKGRIVAMFGGPPEGGFGHDGPHGDHSYHGYHGRYSYRGPIMFGGPMGRRGIFFMPGRGFFGRDSYGGNTDGERYPRHGLRKKMTKHGLVKFEIEKETNNTTNKKHEEHGAIWYIITAVPRSICYGLWLINLI